MFSLWRPQARFWHGSTKLVADVPPSTFVTCFYGILEPKGGHLVYANAGHDLPYLWHGGYCEELRARGMPLGLMPGMEYEEKEITLKRGEGVLFYSDGLVEAQPPLRDVRLPAPT